LLFLVLMHHDRNAKFLHFFCSSYHPRYYYWECIDIVKKLLLVGFAVMFKRGSLVQLACGILVALAYFSLVLQYEPYKEGGFLSKSSSLMLVLALFGALLIKVSDGSSESVYEEGYTSTFVTGLVLFFNLGVISQAGTEVLLSGMEVLSMGGSHGKSSREDAPQEGNVQTEEANEGKKDIRTKLAKKIIL